MLTEMPVLGLVDLGGAATPGAASGIDLFPKPVAFAGLRLGVSRLKPQEVIGFLRVHAARTRRRAAPARAVNIDVLTPTGMRAVEITFQDP